MNTIKPATPLPWVSRKAPDGRWGRTIYAESDIGKSALLPIADCFDDHHVYIVHACNRYPLLIGLLRDAREGFRDQAERDGGTLHQKANAAYESINNVLKELGELE